MGRFDDEGIREQRLQRLRIATPEYGDEGLGGAVRVRPRVQRADRRFGDGLPTFALVAVRMADPHGQAPVEQHDALPGPRCQVAVVRHGQAKVVGQLLIDVGEASGNRPDIGGHAETQADRMARGGVGILTDDQHLDVVERNGECTQNVLAGGQVGAACGDLSPEEIAHAMHLRLHIGQRRGPTGLDKFG